MEKLIKELWNYLVRFSEWSEKGGWKWLILIALLFSGIMALLTDTSNSQPNNAEMIAKDTTSSEVSTKPVVIAESDSVDSYEPKSTDNEETSVGSTDVEAIVVEIDAASNMTIEDRVILSITYYPSYSQFGVTHINGKEWGKTPYGSKYVVANELSHYKALQMYRFSVRRNNNIFFLFNTDAIEIEW